MITSFCMDKNKKCKKWIQLSNQEAIDVGLDPFIKCKYCKDNFARLYGVHCYNELGEATCDRCKLDINLAYFCIFCGSHS